MIVKYCHVHFTRFTTKHILWIYNFFLFSKISRLSKLLKVNSVRWNGTTIWGYSKSRRHCVHNPTRD